MIKALYFAVIYCWSQIPSANYIYTCLGGAPNSSVYISIYLSVYWICFSYANKHFAIVAYWSTVGIQDRIRRKSGGEDGEERVRWFGIATTTKIA